MNNELRSFSHGQLKKVLPTVEIKNLYELQGREEQERQTGIQTLAQAYLGFASLEVNDITRIAVETRIEKMAKRSAASHFGHLRRTGILEDSDILPDGTINTAAVAERLSYLDQNDLDSHLRFLQNYQVSKSTLNKIPERQENALHIGIGLNGNTYFEYDTDTPILEDLTPPIMEVVKPDFIARELIPGVQINVPTSSYQQRNRGSFFKGITEKVRPLVQSAQRAMNIFIS